MRLLGYHFRELKSFSLHVTSLRRRSDRVMRWNMLWAAMASIIFNLLGFYFVFHITALHGLWSFMERHSHIEDKVVVLTCIALITIVFLLVLYSLKVNILLTDIKRLLDERERYQEAKNQRQKIESLGLMASGISHEINTSLQTILGSCEMARNKIKDPDKCLTFIQRAIDNSLHARRVINNVLTFTSAGGVTQLEPLSLNDLLAEAMEYTRAFFSSEVKISNVPLHLNPIVYVDRVSFIQIISNLISNAAQAMNHHGVVTIETDILEIEKQTDKSLELPKGRYVTIKVSDTGCGISPEDISRIFDPFFTTKNIGEGTGLGLSIVHGLVKSMNGYITVTSEVHKGSQFSVILPMMKDSKNGA